jgi:uracil-DNA glycosylase
MMARALQALEREVSGCRVCRDTPGPGKLPLPHEPRPVVQLSATARILIAGQAPGTRVHASGRPFTDPSGDRLRDWMGVSPETFYDASKVAILPMGFCFPGLDASGGDLPPRKECAPLWRARIMAAMPQVSLVLAIGMYAQKWHLAGSQESSLTQTVAQWREYRSLRPVSVIPMPHPSWRNTGWLKKNPWFGSELLPALQGDVNALVG